MDKQLKDKPQDIEVLKIYIVESTFENMVRTGLLSREEYELIGSEPNGEEWPDDPVWLELKRKSGKAYKKFKKYCYEKRHRPGAEAGQ